LENVNSRGSTPLMYNEYSNMLNPASCGERVITSTVDTHYKFAGMERDAESGLDHTLYRQYTCGQGRWLTPDRLGGSILNPQSLNRYAYALDNPTSLIDPLGLGHCSIAEGWDAVRDPHAGAGLFGDPFTLTAPGQEGESLAGTTFPPSYSSDGSSGPPAAGCGDGSSKRWTKALAKLDSAQVALEHLNPSADCQKDLNAISAATGLSLAAIQDQANFSNWNDATTSTTLQVGLFTVGSTDYNFWSGKGTTIEEYFKNNPDVKGEAAQPGTPLAGNIYFVPGYVNGHSAGYDAALLMHEVTHNLGATDPQLKAALGFKEIDPSQYVTGKLAKDCFGVTK
jgi:RHS repeat-associated protein